MLLLFVHSVLLFFCFTVCLMVVISFPQFVTLRLLPGKIKGSCSYLLTYLLTYLFNHSHIMDAKLSGFAVLSVQVRWTTEKSVLYARSCSRKHIPGLYLGGFLDFYNPSRILSSQDSLLWQIGSCSFLADRTNGRAIGTVLRPSVVCRRLSVT